MLDCRTLGPALATRTGMRAPARLCLGGPRSARAPAPRPGDRDALVWFIHDAMDRDPVVRLPPARSTRARAPGLDGLGIWCPGGHLLHRPLAPAS